MHTGRACLYYRGIKFNEVFQFAKVNSRQYLKFLHTPFLIGGEVMEAERKEGGVRKKLKINKRKEMC